MWLPLTRPAADLSPRGRGEGGESEGRGLWRHDRTQPLTSPDLIRGLLQRAVRVERSVGPGASPGEVRGRMAGSGSVAMRRSDRPMVAAHPHPGPPHKGEGGVPPGLRSTSPREEGGLRAGVVAVTYPSHCTSPDLIRGLLHRAARVEISVGPGASPGEVGADGGVGFRGGGAGGDRPMVAAHPHPGPPHKGEGGASPTRPEVDPSPRRRWPEGPGWWQ